MKQWIAAGAAVVVIGLLVLLLREVWSDDAAARPADPEVKEVAKPSLPSRPTPAVAKQVDEEEIPNMGSIEVDESEDHAPIRKFSDKFWEHIDEGYRRHLIGMSAHCYKGGLHRKKKMKVSYKYTIKDGWVSLRDVRMLESNLGDAALEKCIVETLTTAKFQDARMPDWESADNDEETLVIRVMLFKRFMEGQNDGQED
jgi:hypothetical protein